MAGLARALLPQADLRLMPPPHHRSAPAPSKMLKMDAPVLDSYAGGLAATASAPWGSLHSRGGASVLGGTVLLQPKDNARATAIRYRDHMPPISRTHGTTQAQGHHTRRYTRTGYHEQTRNTLSVEQANPYTLAKTKTPSAATHAHRMFMCSCSLDFSVSALMRN